jgi:hypothetical protein
MDKVRASLRVIEGKPMRAITPIIFRLSEAAPLEDLLDSGRVVSFDLDGAGRPQRYTWLRCVGVIPMEEFRMNVGCRGTATALSTPIVRTGKGRPETAPKDSWCIP